MDEKELEHRPLIGRLAGLAAIAFFIPALVPGDSSKFFSNLSSPQIVDWAAHNGRAISLQAFGQAFGATVFALFIVLLLLSFILAASVLTKSQSKTTTSAGDDHGVFNPAHLTDQGRAIAED